MTTPQSRDQIDAGYAEALKRLSKETICRTGPLATFVEELRKTVLHESPDQVLSLTLRDTLVRMDIVTWDDLAQSEFMRLAKVLLGSHYPQFAALVAVFPRLPYSVGWSRRSLRSREVYAYSVLLEVTLRALWTREVFDIPADELFDKRPFNHFDWQLVQAVPYLIAAELLTGNASVKARVLEAIRAENNHQRLSRDILAAIVIANDAELVDWEGKLLLAAQLQEGLRQAIVETMDLGQPEAFRTLLGIVEKENLIRFSSVKRGLMVTLGLSIEGRKLEARTDDILHLMMTYLTDKGVALRAIQDVNPIAVYVALWRLGFDAVEDVVPVADELIQSGAVHQLHALALFLEALNHEKLSQRLAMAILERWYKEPSVIAGMVSFYPLGAYYARNPEEQYELPSSVDWRSHVEAWQYVLDHLKGPQTYSGYVFPWNEQSLMPDAVAERLYGAALMTGDRAYREAFKPYFSQLSAWTKQTVLEEDCGDTTDALSNDYLFMGLDDRSNDVKRAALGVLARQTLTEEQIRQLEVRLASKGAQLRMGIIDLLKTLDVVALTSSVERLLSDRSADRRLAALDILVGLTGDKAQTLLTAATPWVAGITKPTAKEKVLIERLGLTETETKATPSEKPNPQKAKKVTAKSEATSPPTVDPAQYRSENGFGLFEPVPTIVIPDYAFDEAAYEEGLAFLHSDEPIQLFEALGKLLEANADLPVEYDGESTRLAEHLILDQQAFGLTALAHPELWTRFYTESVKEPWKLLWIMFLYRTAECVQQFDLVKRVLTPKQGLLGKLKARFTTSGWEANRQAMAMKSSQNTYRPYRIVRALHETYGDQNSALTCASLVLERLNQALKPDEVYEKVTNIWSKRTDMTPIHDSVLVYFWLSLPSDKAKDEVFTRYFWAKWRLYAKTDYFSEVNPEQYVWTTVSNGITLAELLRARQLGLISADDVTREWVGSALRIEYIQEASRLLNGWRRLGQTVADQVDLNAVRERYNPICDRVLDAEVNRLESATALSDYAMKMDYMEGASRLVRVLTALGSDKLSRARSTPPSKREVLTHLIEVSRPAPEDTPETLKALLSEAKIAEERLIEVSFLAPKWLPLFEPVLGIPHLTSAVFYFKAHAGEVYSNEDKARLARFTPIAPEDLEEGAFDSHWFEAIYKALGKTRFDRFYRAARFISSSNKHTRAREFADAVRGELDKAKALEAIVEKRNQTLLKAYGLIVLDESDPTDLATRYQVIQRFAKESRQFGAQRRQSEKRAVEIALDNLALTAGFSDRTRLIWRLETELLDQMAAYFTPRPVGDVTVALTVNADGKTALVVQKGERVLKSVPAAIKKDAYVLECRERMTELNDQHQRARYLLEELMENQTAITVKELTLLTKNPVIAPLLASLVWAHDAAVGFFRDARLVTEWTADVNPDVPRLSDNTELRLAHPVELYRRGVWADFQRVLFDAKVQQPFKQVFRELYLPTDEEKASTESLRYAGHQVQPAKTVGLLKGRLWRADYEEGLQKVYWRDDIVATFVAMADWFSPADIEYPTLEGVRFYRRSSGERLTLSAVPEVIFSEVMRDVDLVVSVAHAGGVDPEASHSTMEMRAVIAQLTCELLKLTNVTFVGNFAHIAGERSEYRLHLGSGEVHLKSGKHIPVLPVHSQHKGRIFLPFVDDDPKTAEILSKMILFAEDRKIKDPAILDAID